MERSEACREFLWFGELVHQFLEFAEKEVRVGNGVVRPECDRFRPEMRGDRVDGLCGLVFGLNHVLSCLAREHLDEERVLGAVGKFDIDPAATCPETGAVPLSGHDCVAGWKF